jgi:hypothetical protein
MLEPLVEPNLQHFPSSRKRAMTGLKVVEEEQANRRRQRRLAAVAAEEDRAQDEHEERKEERTAMIADRWHQSQSQFSSLDLGSSSNPSSKDESSSSSKADNTKALDHDIFDEDRKLRRSDRVRRPLETQLRRCRRT